MGRQRKGKGKQTEIPSAVPTVGASTEGRGEDGGKDNDSAQTTSGRGFADEGQLLSGIPNEITLNHISTKLPWKAFHILSSVSRDWRNAIQNYEVYHARVCSHSMETLVVLNHVVVEDEDLEKEVDEMSLYSMTDKTFHKLPSIPQFERGVPRGSSCVFLDGKIYVLGGDFPDGGRDVFVLDLVGQREWRRCADMQSRRSHFECGVLDGKIYAFGPPSEVYDPRDNSWSSIAAMTTSRLYHKVKKFGNKLIVYGGFNPDDFNDGDDKLLSVEVYDPDKDEWTVILEGGHGHDHKVFMARGRFYRMTMNHISVCELEKEKIMHTFLLPRIHSQGINLPPTDLDWCHCSVRAVGDELMINGTTYRNKLYVVVSKGFGTKRKELQWERIDSPFSHS